jgi:predicted nucleotidyltransferase
MPLSDEGGFLMAFDYETVREMAKKYAADVRKEFSIDRAILYGSYVKGTADEWSYVDVCFSLKDFGKKNWFEMTLYLTHMGRKYEDVCFEPKAFKTSEMKNDNPLVSEILRTGVDI